jgi:hypothetical protein
MAILSNNDRAEIWAKWMRENPDVTGALTKAQLRLAVDAIDQWSEDNTTAFNNAIPQPARGVLTTKQKARIFMEVVRQRFNVA